jgi:hypothetical protein
MVHSPAFKLGGGKKPGQDLPIVRTRVLDSRLLLPHPHLPHPTWLPRTTLFVLFNARVRSDSRRRISRSPCSLPLFSLFIPLPFFPFLFVDKHSSPHPPRSHRSFRRNTPTNPPLGLHIAHPGSDCPSLGKIGQIEGHRRARAKIGRTQHRVSTRIRIDVLRSVSCRRRGEG